LETMSKTANGTADGSTMSLRSWARSRGIPVSTAYNAAATGYLSRLPDGRVDPETADREFEGSRRRVDSPALRRPALNAQNEEDAFSEELVFELLEAARRLARKFPGIDPELFVKYMTGRNPGFTRCLAYTAWGRNLESALAQLTPAKPGPRRSI
jgi:hypothetical protein